MASSWRTLLLAGLLLATPLLGEDQPICRNLKCWYDQYNKAYFGGALPNADVAYGTCPIANVQACSWVEHGRAYVRLIPKYNLAPDTAHFALLHEACHLANYEVELGDHGPRWQACMHRLADAKAFESLW